MYTIKKQFLKQKSVVINKQKSAHEIINLNSDVEERLCSKLKFI